MIDAATKAGVATIVIDLNLRISQGDAAEAVGTVLSGVGVRCLADCEHVESGDFESSLGLSKIQARSLCKRMIKLAESSGGQIPSAVLSTLQDEERTTPERNAEPPAADCLEVSVEKEVAEEDTMMGAAGSDAYSSDSDEEFIPDDSHDASETLCAYPSRHRPIRFGAFACIGSRISRISSETKLDQIMTSSDSPSCAAGAGRESVGYIENGSDAGSGARRAVTTVNNASPTGTTEEDNISMAIAIHIGKTSRMDYDYKRTDPMSWVNYLAYLVLKNEPKWSGAADVGIRDSQSVVRRFVPTLITASDATAVRTSSDENES
eukprot:IDg1268t1